MVDKDDRVTFWQIRTIFTRLKSTKKSTKKVPMVHDINFKANSSFIVLGWKSNKKSTLKYVSRAKEFDAIACPEKCQCKNRYRKRRTLEFDLFIEFNSFQQTL